MSNRANRPIGAPPVDFNNIGAHSTPPVLDQAILLMEHTEVTPIPRLSATSSKALT